MSRNGTINLLDTRTVINRLNASRYTIDHLAPASSSVVDEVFAMPWNFDPLDFNPHQRKSRLR